MACEAMLLSASSVSRWIARPFRGSWRPGPAAFPLGPDEVLLGIPYMQFSRFMRGVIFNPSYMYCKFKSEKRALISVNFLWILVFQVIYFFRFSCEIITPPYILLHLQNRKTKLQLYELFVNLSLWSDLPPHISIGHLKAKNAHRSSKKFRWLMCAKYLRK